MQTGALGVADESRGLVAQLLGLDFVLDDDLIAFSDCSTGSDLYYDAKQQNTDSLIQINMTLISKCTPRGTESKARTLTTTKGGIFATLNGLPGIMLMELQQYSMVINTCLELQDTGR